MTEFSFILEDSERSKQTPNITKLSHGFKSDDGGRIIVPDGSEKVIINFELLVNITSINLTIFNSNAPDTNAVLTEIFFDFLIGKHLI